MGAYRLRKVFYSVLCSVFAFMTHISKIKGYNLYYENNFYA